MENKGLVFIPDISGFSRFVNETEVEHSRIIIQEFAGGYYQCQPNRFGCFRN